MIGHPGPYINDDGDIWVPRTVSYLEARRVAKDGLSDYDDRLVYIGKSDEYLLGFVRGCECEEGCYGGPVVDYEASEDPACKVPAWHFKSVER